MVNTLDSSPQLVFPRSMPAGSPLGHLFWFTVEDTLRPIADVIQTITNYGLAHYGLPETVSPPTAARRASQMLTRQAQSKTLVRTLHRDRDTWTQHWIRETVNSQNTEIEFTPLGEIRWAKGSAWHLQTQALHAMTSDEQDAWTALPDFWHTAETHLTAGDMRRQILQWLRVTHPIAMQHAGPVTFVPPEGTGLLDELREAQAGLGITAWMLPLAPESGVESTIIESLQAQLQAESNALIRRIQKAQASGHPLSAIQEKRLLEEFQTIRLQAEQYRDLFRHGLDHVEADLDLTRQQIRNALSL